MGNRGSRGLWQGATILALLLAAPAGARATSLIDAVRLGRSAYAPGVPVAIEVELENATGAPFAGEIALTASHLGESVGAEQTVPVSLGVGAAATVAFTWSPPGEDFRGYLVQAVARQTGGAIVDTAATGVDVSSDWKRFPRYGFVSRFDAGLDAAATMRWLADHHVNGVQFYDWQWQHHRPYSPDPTWPDIANRTIDRATVEALLAEASGRGMVTMSYNLAAAAYDGYWADGSGVLTDWGLFRRSGEHHDATDQDSHPLPSSWATPRLYQMDPSNPEWQAYICARQQEVFDELGFDGWHVDTLGNRGRLWNAQGEFVLLAETFAPFVNAMRACLGDRRLVFNTVGTFGQEEIASGADVDVIYSELWDGAKTRNFYDLAKVTAAIREHTPKGIVFPGYMNYEYAKATPDGTTREFNEPSVRLADAAMLALGAAHLELGDLGGMLSSEYFPNQKLVMGDSLRAAVRDLYSFQVAYQNLLRDGAVPVKSRVDTPGFRSNTRGSPRGIWKIVTAQPDRLVVSLVNLTGTRAKRWRDSFAQQTAAPLLESVSVKAYHGLAGTPRVRVASPDFDHGVAAELPAVAGSDARGAYVSFTVPRLLYWTVVWIEAGA